MKKKFLLSGLILFLLIIFQTNTINAETIVKVSDHYMVGYKIMPICITLLIISFAACCYITIKTKELKLDVSWLFITVAFILAELIFIYALKNDDFLKSFIKVANIIIAVVTAVSIYGVYKKENPANTIIIMVAMLTITLGATMAFCEMNNSINYYPIDYLPTKEELTLIGVEGWVSIICTTASIGLFGYSVMEWVKSKKSKMKKVEEK